MTQWLWEQRLRTMAPEQPVTSASDDRRRHRGLRQTVVDTALLGVDEFRDAQLGHISDEIVDALHRISPTADASMLDSLPSESAAGWLNTLKGALFELRVDQAVRNGSISLPESATSFRLVDSFTTPGYDALLLDRNGQIVEVVQLKASSNADLIAHHLHLHPQIDSVWATSEAAHDAASRGISGVLDTGITDHSMASTVHGALHGARVLSPLDLLDEVVPQTAFLFIGIRLVWEIRRGTPSREALRAAGSRATIVTVTSGIAGLSAVVTGTEAVRLPIVLTAVLLRVIHLRLSSAPEVARASIDRLGMLLDPGVGRRLTLAS